MFNQIKFPIIFFTILLFTKLYAEDQGASGEIEFEDPSIVKHEGAVSNPQDQTIALFEKLLDKIKELKSGNVSQFDPGEIDVDMYKHLNAVYLYCAINKGVCPEVLNTVMEIDVINSKVSGKVACPVMKKFWRSWLDNDMEKKHGFKVKTAFANVTASFKVKDRPRYLKCDQTIQEIIAADPSSNFFANRYSGKSYSEAAATLEYMKDIKEKVPDLLYSVSRKS